MSRPKLNSKPAISIADCEAAVWRLTAVVYRDRRMAKVEMAKVVAVIEQFALSCGADPLMVSKGLLPGLPAVRRIADPDEVTLPRSEPRIHLIDQGEMAVCKQTDVAVTNVRDDVTCGNCKRWMKSQDRIAAMPLRDLVVETSQHLDTSDPVYVQPVLPLEIPPPMVILVAAPGKRICRGPCGREKDLQDFAKDAKNTEGRKTVCRSCDNERRRSQAVSKRAAAASEAA